MSFQFLIPYLSYILSSFLVLILLYTKTFISERAKNKALIKDIKQLTDEKEFVTLKYQKEIEQIKKEHELDIAKRRYQYESKRDAYNKFLIFLDNYNSKVGEELTSKIFPVVAKFIKDYLNANTQSKKTTIISTFFNNTLEYSKDAYAEYTKLKQETNSIKLSASSFVLKSLEDLESFTKESLEESELMMKRMPVLIASEDKNFIADYQNYIETLGNKIAVSKKHLIEFMKLDLETI